ncbi:MAG: tRNA (N(6)-L-threonylcarbamoyladenosine(37)-C(2))-methylthiotransferase MtaB [Eubacterium sp.]|nr:tRNA (N(6)-L-threonylcarbamoyladenosine(37)-C(2))-methylthiotransferase MtaB [Eubacterium sp.]
MKTAALHNLGCKVNAFETEAMQELLENDGYEIVDFSERADVYVINTCTVTNIADRKSRQMLHRARKLNPDAVIVAAGCYVQNRMPGDAAAGQDADVWLGTGEKTRLVSAIDEFLAKRDAEREDALCYVNDISRGSHYEPMEIKVATGRERAFIKVEDGCNMFCSYCIIPYVRGRVRSASADDIVRQVKSLVDGGYREIVFNGIHLDSYGVDTGDTLVGLLGRVARECAPDRIRLGSLEPGFISDDNVARLKEIPGLCPHFHLSLQSGCDTVLERMRRRYDTEKYARAVDSLREAFDRPAITTDIICGFPGESEDEFAQTEEFVRRIGFSDVHLFPYSRRKGTRADAMDGQLTEKEKKDRVRRLSETVASCRRAYEDSLVGSEASVLVEEEITRDGQSCFKGHCPRYLEVAVTGGDAVPGQIVTGTLSRGDILGDGSSSLYLSCQMR